MSPEVSRGRANGLGRYQRYMRVLRLAICSNKKTTDGECPSADDKQWTVFGKIVFDLTIGCFHLRDGTRT